MKKKIILASASPRRKELLERIGLQFEIIPSNADENIEGQEFSEKLIEQLAIDKATDVAKKTKKSALVIGADTIVVCQNKVLGKPIDKDDAREMIKHLSGNIHEVVTGIAIIDTETNTTLSDFLVTKVKFKELTDLEIENYLSTDEPYDKAGAYAAQGIGAMFIEEINGCYNNVVGLSVYKLSEMMKKLGYNLI